MKTLALVLSAMVFCAATAVRGDLVINSGFEDNNPVDGNFGDDWGSFGSQAFLDFFANGNPGHATFFADNAGNSGGFYQQGIAGAPGDVYQFSIDAAFEANWSATTSFGLEFYEADDSTMIDSITVEIPVPLSYTGYSNYVMQATAPAGTVYVRPIVTYGSVTDVQGSSEAATFDNAMLTIIPEPSAGLLLLGGAGLLAIGRRWRPAARI